MRGEGEDVCNNSCEFEFSFCLEEAVYSPIHNGRITPICSTKSSFPAAEIKTEDSNDFVPTEKIKRKALRNLFMEERPHISSDQVSNNKFVFSELNSLPTDSYCVWEPHKTGKGKVESSSKRWRLKDLLTRNKSERGNNKVNDEKAVRKMGLKEGGIGSSRSSYLPYRHELLFGSGRVSHRFLN